jgi:chemotaxis protein MotA
LDSWPVPGVLATLILLGGDLRMFADMHAAIVIFGGSFAATAHPLPAGFNLSRASLSAPNLPSLCGV